MSGHEDFSRRPEMRQSSDGAFGFVMAIVFGAIGFWPILYSQSVRGWAVGTSAGFALVSLTFPIALRPLNLLWTRIGLLLHRIINPLVTAVLFYSVFVPTGLLLRLFGKDMLRLRIDRDAQTYWIPREPPGPAPHTITNQF
jgi:hypothetical protein